MRYIPDEKMLSCPSEEYSLGGTTVCLFLPTHFYYYYTPLLPLICISTLLKSLLSSLLIRMGRVLVGRGRRQCPSAAACQRRRSAVLQTVSTPWLVSSYSVTLLNIMHLHEIFNVQCMPQGFLVDYRLLSLSNAELVQKWNEVSSAWVTASSISCYQVEGSELKKIRTNSRVYQRYYLLDTGLQALCWEPSKKESDKARISLASIREVSVQRKKLCKLTLYETHRRYIVDIYNH